MVVVSIFSYFCPNQIKPFEVTKIMGDPILYMRTVIRLAFLEDLP
jgi:hypothetical protein